MRRLSVITLLILLLTEACTKAPEGSYRGKKMLQDKEIRIDSLIIDADTTSLAGTFILKDSTLYFIDLDYCKIFEFSLSDGSLRATYSQRGQGPEDMLGVMNGVIIEPADTSIWIVDSSFGIYNFSPQQGKVKYQSRLNFSWEEHERNDFNHPSVYKYLEPNISPTAYQIDDTTVMLQVSIADRLLKEVNSERYKSGHFLGMIDTRTLKVREVTGRYPESFLERPTPFEFMTYTIDPNRERLYVSFAPDSLIYCYNLDNLTEPVYSFGFEPDGVDRDYSIGYFQPEEYAKWTKDREHVGANFKIYYDATDDVVLRTTSADMKEGTMKLQVYKDDNLIQEHTMPRFFKLLGRYGDKYYGVRYRPVETDDECHYTIYSFTL